MIYRKLDTAGHLSFEGKTRFKYIPVKEDVELRLGEVDDVLVDLILMEYRTDNFMFDGRGNIEGWDEIKKFEVTVKNTRTVPAEVEIKRNINSRSWDLEADGEYGEFRKVDKDTIQFRLKLDPGRMKKFSYILTSRQGRRAQ